MYQIPGYEEAFKMRGNELNKPIDKAQHDFRFTRRWFVQRNQVTWNTYLAPMFSAAKPCRMLQIGVFEGMDLVWCLQNFMQHKDSVAIAVDPWEDTGKLDAKYMVEVEQRARHNLAPWRNKVRIIKGSSQEILPPATKRSRMLEDVACGAFDLTIIDGDHNADPVYEDAVNCLELLRPGGVMVFDDVRNRIYKPDHVLHGLQRFLADYDGRVKPAWSHRYCEAFIKLK